MNKILNINLGGYPFTIDDDAYQHLSGYLNTLRKHFSSSEGSEEITSDIEARMAELLVERLDNRQIVSMPDIEGVIDIMGKPEDFGAEGFSEPASAAQGEEEYQTGKRLFRDTENKVVGGVCSGLSAYFGIEDPIWMRVAFVVAFFTIGFSLLIYIILLFIVPEAKTASDRLAMKGKKVNIKNIAKQIEDEIDNFGETISNLGNDFSGQESKKKILKALPPAEHEML